MKWLDRLAPLAVLVGGILVWEGQGRWWLLAPGIVLMAAGLAWWQSGR